MDPEYSGQAIIKYGPVRLDITLKKQIEATLSTGSTIMNAFLCHKEE